MDLPDSGASTASAEQSHPAVELRLPAEGAYVSVLRTTTAGLAARLDFTLDDIEDLRMAVGEAAAMVLESAAPGADVVAKFWLGARQMTVAVSTRSTGEVRIDKESFGWQVLTTLAAAASASTTDDRLEITLVAEATPLGVAL